jgi:hypothetical protein
MKARIRISPSSASVCTKASMCWRSSFNQFTLFGGTHPNDSRAAREVVDLTSELTRAMNRDKGFNTARGAHNFDLAGDHQKEWDISITLLDEHLAMLHCTHMSMSCNATNLRRS